MIANLTQTTNIFILDHMNKKLVIAIIVLGIGIWGILTYSVLDFTKENNIDIVSPIAKIVKNTSSEFGDFGKSNHVFKNEILNVLLIGTDTSEGRRARGQGGFNTDTMILVSVNPKTNKVLLTSVPRDLWVNDNKINALYIVNGEESLKDAFKQITGQNVDGVIRADFDHFTWIIDSFGGVPVEIERTFTDSSFPNTSDSGPITISFTQGSEVMDGQRALVFARSRKGDNGEGSDLMRAKRQHLILKGMINAISQPSSIFWPMDIEKFYNMVTAPDKMDTSLTLADVKYLWDFYKDKDKYEIESFVIDDKYVYHPGLYPESDYHAWVFIAKEPGFANLHTDIMAKLNKTYVEDAETVQE